MENIEKAIEVVFERLRERLDPKHEMNIEQILADADRRKMDARLNCIEGTLVQWIMEREPFEVGKNFVVCRSWQREEVGEDPRFAGRHLLVTDPGVAFGGAHSTTLICASIVEDYWRGGRFLDVGTGTGLLSMIAAIMYPDSKIQAFDISLDVVEHARLHLELNGLTERVELRQAVTADYPEGVYDLVMANLLPDILETLHDDLIRRLKPGGLLVASGFADKKESATYARFDWGITRSSGKNADAIAEMFSELELVERKVDDVWAALVLRRRACESLH